MMNPIFRTRIGTRNDLRTADQTAGDLWRTAWAHPSRTWEAAAPIFRPAMDVIEHKDGVTIRVDLPGLTAEDVHVEVVGDRLTISGELSHAAGEGERYLRRERYAGAFRRSLQLADTFDTDRISAEFKNGVLTLNVPRLPESQPKRIKVKKVKTV